MHVLFPKQSELLALVSSHIYSYIVVKGNQSLKDQEVLAIVLQDLRHPLFTLSGIVGDVHAGFSSAHNGPHFSTVEPAARIVL
jgi:hypothetical protein